MGKLTTAASRLAAGATLPTLDAKYARAVAESAESPPRFDDAMARIDAGHVDVNAYYEHPVRKGVGTPLVFAVIEDELAYVAELLARGADPDRTLAVDEGPFYAPAIFYVRSAEAFELLVKGGARLDAASQGAESFLHHCIRMSRTSRHPLWLRLAQAAVAHGSSTAQADAGGRDAAAFALSMGASIFKLYAQVLGVPAPAAVQKKSPPDKPAASAPVKKADSKKSAAKKSPPASPVKKSVKKVGVKAR